MRKSLELLETEINYIDCDNLYEAINKIKTVLLQLVILADQALPKEVDPD